MLTNEINNSTYKSEHTRWSIEKKREKENPNNLANDNTLVFDNRSYE